MNKEELMAYAIKMYPIGTKFYPVRTDTLEPSKSDDYKVLITPVWSDDVICATGNLYVKGVWAPVISHPEGYVLDEVVNSFPIY
jgi:hypothetical protein